MDVKLDKIRKDMVSKAGTEILKNLDEGLDLYSTEGIIKDIERYDLLVMSMYDLSCILIRNVIDATSHDLVGLLEKIKKDVIKFEQIQNHEELTCH